MVFKNLCILVLWTKVASALVGLSMKHTRRVHGCSLMENLSLLVYCFSWLSLERSQGVRVIAEPVFFLILNPFAACG